MINMLSSRSSGSDSSLGQGHCVMFLGSTLSPCCLWHSPPRCINGYKQIKCLELGVGQGGITLRWTVHSRGNINTPSWFMLQKLKISTGL